MKMMLPRSRDVNSIELPVLLNPPYSGPNESSKEKVKYFKDPPQTKNTRTHAPYRGDLNFLGVFNHGKSRRRKLVTLENGITSTSKKDQEEKTHGVKNSITLMVGTGYL
ncbi:hypothetical protein TNIN_419181 [Trichonephila inaurata madagascariensis]|uniref:Uncharacterized protein n=1 Tax=Trichonephila inaurata madagascariensis TaxID=2747483 RepID=A0A8X7CPQ5_9ARAC|nr:hypothetical protein TNIN_419181 [Trichonephila inaurata madagascariensis]